MNIARYWTVSITAEPDIGKDATGQVLFPAPSVNALRAAVKQLRSRVQGELALAVVPDDENLALADTLVQADLPFHMIAPGEQATLLGRNLSTIRTAAASVNVPPSRGTGRDHWSDCHVWLESIADIRIQIGLPSFVDSLGTPPAKPTVVIHAHDGSVTFHAFPRSGTLVDEDYERVSTYLFKGKQPPTTLVEVKEAASELANRAAPRFRLLQTGSLFMNLAPAVAVGAGAAFLWTRDVVSVWKFIAAMLAALFAFGLKRLSTRRMWLAARATTEICRSLSASNAILDPLFPPAARFLPRHASLSRSLALADATAMKGQGQALARMPLTKVRNHYVEHRLDGQIQYYEKHARSAQRRLRWIRGAFYVFTTLATVSSAVAVLCQVGWFPWVTTEVNGRWIAGFATVAFPALAAAALGYLSLTESSRRMGYYAEIASQLRGRRAVLTSLSSEASITEAIRDTEGMLLEEVAGWLRRQIF